MSATPIILLLGQLGTDEEDNFTILDELPEGPAPMDELRESPTTFDELPEGPGIFYDHPEGPATAKGPDNPGLSVLSSG